MIIEILYNANVNCIEWPVESTIVFDYPDNVVPKILIDEINDELKKISYFILAPIFESYFIDDDPIVTEKRKKSINEILKRIINK